MSYTQQACGHHISLAIYSAEDGRYLYCDLCDNRSARRDAEKMEREYGIKLKEQGSELTRLRAENEALKAEIKILASGYVGSLDISIRPSTRLDYKTLRENDAAREAFNRLVNPYLKAPK